VIRRVAILGTGLMGASVGLALRRAGFAGSIFGWDRSAKALLQAREMGAVDAPPPEMEADDPFICAMAADVIVLAGPVFSIAEWLEQLGPVLGPGQVVTDVGSVKGWLMERAAAVYNGPGQPRYLPGHPMVGKEQSGTAGAEGSLFEGGAWLFLPVGGEAGEHEAEWQEWVRRMGARVVEMGAEEHDRLCAAVSHLPQMVGTALASMLAERFGQNPAEMERVRAVGGRALREMTRLGASPYSMWRDIAHTNAGEIERVLLALEQELAHIRENLRTGELRRSFEEANVFRRGLVG
jgi:prephenate dehydrogenase